MAKEAVESSHRVGKRKQQALDMKEKIQKAAIALFGEKGFENVSMEEIAEKAGCSVGNIYHYFAGKQSLTAGLTHYVDEKYLLLEERYFGEKGEMSKSSAAEKFIDFSAEALKIDSKEPLLFDCFGYSIRYPELEVLRFDSEEVYPRILRRIIKELDEEIGFADPHTKEDVERMFITLNRGLLLQWRIELNGFDIAENGRLMAEAALNGVIRKEQK